MFWNRTISTGKIVWHQWLGWTRILMRLTRSHMEIAIPLRLWMWIYLWPLKGNFVLLNKSILICFVSHWINNLFILIQSLLIMHFRVLSPPGYEPFFSNNTVATSSYSNNNNSKNGDIDANEKLLGSPSQVLPLPESSKDLQLPIYISNEVRWLRLTQPQSII